MCVPKFISSSDSTKSSNRKEGNIMIQRPPKRCSSQLARTHVALTIAILLSLSGNAFSQAVTATLLGTVTDQTGAAVPGANVTIREINTNITRTISSNEEGNYVFSNLTPGNYNVEVEKSGFKKTVQNSVTVLVNSSVRIDLLLEPGGINEVLTITNEPPPLQTDRSDLGAKIDEKQVVDLPLGFNRNFQSLLNLVPGTTRAYRPHSEFFNPQDSLATRVNGQSRLANNVQIEGIDNNHRSGLLTVLIPPSEAIETVDVTTSNYEAELGRAGGAVTNVALRSGTNEFHGSVFAFNRVSKLMARNYFSSTVPHTVYNLFGFTLGGPIVKNRTFFFGDYQGVRDLRGRTYQVAIPTLDFRRGDFRAAGSNVRIVDPATGQQIQCNGVVNVICPERISPVASRILSLLPEPNLLGRAAGQRNYEESTVRQKDIDSFDVKINHTFNQSNNIAVRYSFQRPKVYDPGLYGIYGGPANEGFGGTGITTTQSSGINFTHIFSPDLITEVRLGFSRYRNDATSEGHGLRTSADLGIPGANIDEWSSGISQVRLDGYDVPMVGFSPSLPWVRAETVFNLVNNWTKLAGNHTIKWGIDGRKGYDDLLQTQAFDPRGRFNFNGAITGGTSPAHSMAAFLLDLPNAAGRDLAVLFPALRETGLFTYIQDKWQVTKKLTVDLGLRHEYYHPLRPRYPAGLSNYDVATNSLLLAGVGEVPMDLRVDGSLSNFSPRVGAAYRINDKTVARAGYGISTIPFPDNLYAFNYPVRLNNSYTAPGGTRDAITGSNFGRLSTGFPGAQPLIIPESGIIPVNTPFLVNQDMVVVPEDLKEGYVQSWNVAVQRELPWRFTAEAAYVGNLGVGILARQNLNAGQIPGAGPAGQPYNVPAYGNRRAAINTWTRVTNNYHGLQTKFDRRFSNGFALTTAYTLSKAIDYTADNGELFNMIDIRANRARADFDRTHNFVQSYIYELPFGQGQRWLNSGVANWIAGGWQINGIFTAMSGTPINITYSNAFLNAPGNNNRPNITGSPTILEGIGPGVKWFDTTVFSAPANNTFGSLGRNVINGPGFVNLDLSLFKKLALTETTHLELRAEAFNVTNTPHFENPQGNFSNLTTFGQVTSALPDQRQIQLGVKLKF
jgi:hypothetical protein